MTYLSKATDRSRSMKAIYALILIDCLHDKIMVRKCLSPYLLFFNKGTTRASVKFFGMTLSESDRFTKRVMAGPQYTSSTIKWEWGQGHNAYLQPPSCDVDHLFTEYHSNSDRNGTLAGYSTVTIYVKCTHEDICNMLD